MFTINRILCPIDFSSAALQALEAARDLAVQFSSELLIVHVVKHHVGLVPPAGMALPVYYQRQMQEAETAVKNAADRCIDSAVTVRSYVRSADPAHEIIKIAREESADLIVIATHGESALHQLLFGSVAEKVIRFSPCPLLVVPAPRDNAEGENTKE